MADHPLCTTLIFLVLCSSFSSTSYADFVLRIHLKNQLSSGKALLVIFYKGKTALSPTVVPQGNHFVEGIRIPFKNKWTWRCYTVKVSTVHADDLGWFLAWYNGISDPIPPALRPYLNPEGPERNFIMDIHYVIFNTAVKLWNASSGEFIKTTTLRSRQDEVPEYAAYKQTNKENEPN